MELAKNLAQWRDQSPDQWLAQANRLLPPIVVALLVILLAAGAADLTWQLLQTPARQDVVPVASAAQTGSTSRTQDASYAALQGWRPFGDPPAADAGAIPAEAVLDAPETTLPLTLHGTVEVQDLPERGTLVIPDAGAAIISGARSEAQFYRTGEPIEEGNGATLHSVYFDRVILDRNGRHETLKYPEQDSSSMVSSRSGSGLTAGSSRPPANPRADPASQVTLLDAMNDIGTTLTQHMQVTAAVENGQTVGYRLQPRGDSQVFAELGLEPGDIMTEVNGIPMTNINNTVQIFQALGQTTQASVMIRRNGFDQAMIIDLSQIERLAQSLQ
jgi:general secretion pathway protein C